MNYASIEISIAAVVPALLLMIFVFIKDRAEKEPFGLLALLFAAGGLVYMPLWFLETKAGVLLDSMFSKYKTYTHEGAVNFTSETAETVYNLLFSFVVVALLEETVKWAVLYFITRKNKNFNYMFDGIVYSVFVSMGFAAVENIRYAWEAGWDTLFLRSVASVPAHLFFGVITGCCYTFWHTRYIAKQKETELAKENKITVKKPFKSGGLLLISWLVAVLLHGIFSTVMEFSSTTLTLGFYVITTAIYLVCFIAIDRMSDTDAANNRSVFSLLSKKYPDVKFAFVDDGDGIADNDDITVENGEVNNDEL